MKIFMIKRNKCKVNSGAKRPTVCWAGPNGTFYDSCIGQSAAVVMFYVNSPQIFLLANILAH